MRKKILAYDKIDWQTYSRAESGEMLPNSKEVIKVLRNGVIDYGGNLVMPMLTGAAQRYLSFILNDMDGNNQFGTNKIKRRTFIEGLNEQLGVNYKLDYVTRLLTELKATGFIIRECQGVYFVNPLIYWCGLDLDRMETIKYMLNPSNIDIDQENINAAILLNNTIIDIINRAK